MFLDGLILSRLILEDYLISKELAFKLWEDVFGKEEWASDCFGIMMNKYAWSDEEVILLKPGNTKKYDYSWNVDHIRPKSNFENEIDSNFLNNFEPMHRLNNQEKSDSYPIFYIDGKKYQVFRQEGYYGYGILDVTNNKKIDWKSRTHKNY